MAETGTSVAYTVGTMIEVPRAALTADEIAREADFFSFGTNDLTQMTFAFSRDDAEGKFLPHYLESGILPDNPFITLDERGVGKLIAMGVAEGRKTRPNLKAGICGEHGGRSGRSTFATAWASTTSAVRRTACRWPVWRRPRPSCGTAAVSTT